ncbi:MAG: hypothetical protein L0Z50_03980 [Verrucomicrobiales bacterium]|nr:hypothetical protein [Verrucomicrobiales bacterium]
MGNSVDRDAKPNAFVVADGDSGQRRFTAANDIPSRPDQMHEVAHTRQCDRAMRIVRQQRLAGRCKRAVHNPIVAAVVGIESDRPAGSSRDFENLGVDPLQIEASRDFEAAERICLHEFLNHLSAAE